MNVKNVTFSDYRCLHNLLFVLFDMDFIETQRSTYVDLSDRYAILADLQSKK